MIQQDIFFDKKYCMKTLKNGDVPYKISNVERPSSESSGCSAGNKTCGSGQNQICVPSTIACPINGLQLMPKAEAHFFTNHVPFGDQYGLVFKNDGADLPLVSV